MDKSKEMKDINNLSYMSNESLARSMRRQAISVFMHMDEEEASIISKILLEGARRVESDYGSRDNSKEMLING